MQVSDFGKLLDSRLAVKKHDFTGHFTVCQAQSQDKILSFTPDSVLSFTEDENSEDKDSSCPHRA